jgi:hypothetical protein
MVGVVLGDVGFATAIVGESKSGSEPNGLVVVGDRPVVTIRENIVKLKQQQERSLDETIAAKPTRAFDAKWGQFLVTPDLFTRLVYEGV